MKKLTVLTTMFALMAAASIVNAKDISVGFDAGSSKSVGTIPVVPAPTVSKDAPSKAKMKKWTVMVFVNAKNNLEMAGLYNLNQMEKVGSDANINILAELGRMKGQAGDTDLDGDWTGARRIYVTKDKDEEKISSKVVEKVDKVDMGDYKRVVDFVKWSKKNYPASRYMLILWDHGSGWMDPQQTTNAQKGISFDDETNNYIRTKQIGSILKEAGKVDVLAFDACLMQMGEVSFEVKDNTEVIVGSEETVPGLGYPYNLFLGALAKNSDMTNADLGRTMVAAYKMSYDSMAGAKKPVQLSAIRSAKLGELGTLVKDFAAQAKALNEPEAFIAARNGVIRYDMIGKDSDPALTISFYGDLHQYAGLLAKNLKGTDEKTLALKAKAAELQKFIDGQLVIANAAIGKNRTGREMTESRGISVYLPPTEARISQAKLEGIFEGAYTSFEFDKATAWHDYVTMLYGIKPVAPTAPAPVAQPATRQ